MFFDPFASHSLICFTYAGLLVPLLCAFPPSFCITPAIVNRDVRKRRKSFQELWSEKVLKS